MIPHGVGASPSHAGATRIRSAMHLLIEDPAGRIQTPAPDVITLPASGPPSSPSRPGPPRPAGEIPGTAWGASLGPTVLEMAGRLPDVSAPRVVARAGFLADEDAPGSPDPRTWGPVGWSAFERSLAASLASPGPRLLIRPAATDVISDAPSCLRFLQRRGQWGESGAEAGVARLGLLLDPVAMLAPSMHASAEDHVDRILHLVVSSAGVDAVALVETPLIPFAKLVEVFRGAAPADMPLVISMHAARAHASLLGLGDAARE